MNHLSQHTGRSQPADRSPDRAVSRLAAVLVTVTLTIGVCLVSCACAALPGEELPQQALGHGPVPPRYQGSLEALSSALEERLDTTAWNIVRRMRIRLVRDQARGLQDLSGARAFVEGCARVLEGRSRVSACSFELEFRRNSEARELELLLLIQNRWPRDLVFVPGAVQLTVDRAFIEANGEMASVTRRVVLPTQPGWRAKSGEGTEVSLGPWPLTMASESLAGRIVVSLKLIAPKVRDGEHLFGVAGFGVASAPHVELAGFLPTQALQPKDLVPAVLDSNIGIYGLIERVVRLDPAAYGAAEEQILLLIERATDLEITARIAPVLRWITSGVCPGSDPREWRLWALEQKIRTSHPGPPSVLDLPGS
jgi:hypothetical protein